MLQESEAADWERVFAESTTLDLLVSPHDIWDLEVDGGLTLESRRGLVTLHTPARGIDDDTLEWPAKWPPTRRTN